jgi:putative transposase
MMAERGSPVDHSNLYRWVQKFIPKLESAFRNGKKRMVGKSWRMDETYIKITGQWKYLYRAVDKNGPITDCLTTIHRVNKNRTPNI